jgi:hypothetical protein
MIENFKIFLREIRKVNEVVDLAIKIQNMPYSEKSADDLTFLLDLMQRRTDHIQNQLVKGIEIIKELERIEDASKDMKGVEIYVMPFVHEYDCACHSNIGHSSLN